MSIVSGDAQVANVSGAVSAPLVVKVTDRNGAGLAGVLVTFTRDSLRRRNVSVHRLLSRSTTERPVPR